MAQEPKNWMNEPDIGSGERTPGQEDMERDARSVGQPSPNGDGAAGRVLQSGNHLARIRATQQHDGTFEAQVYVRLTREPETAETYIPAGTFMSEAEAWQAAEERALRAFREHEF